MLCIADRQIVRRCGLDTCRWAYTVTAQELQQVRHLVSFTTAGLGANALVSTPTTALVPLDVHFAEIGQHYTVLRKPTIECRRVPYFDVNDVRRVLLVDQGCDKRAKMASEWTSGAANEGRGALIRSSPDALPAGGSASEENFYVRRIERQRAADHLNRPTRDIIQPIACRQ
jgi:hypothetical protein